MAKITTANQDATGIPTPSSGNTQIFVDTDKKLKTKDDTGLVVNYAAAASGITSLTGEVTASGSGSVPATVTNAAVIAKVLTGYVATTGTVTAADSILTALQKLGGRLDISWFGDGRDGTVTLSSNTTLVRDMYYDVLTVNSGVFLDTAGFRIHAKSNVHCDGTIYRAPNSGAGNAAGSALAAGVVAGSSAGGIGGGVGAGTAGAAASPALGGIGGAGGTGSAGAGGTAGALTVPTAVQGGLELFASVRQATVCELLGATKTLVIGGAGGGGGGGNGTGSTGGGGGGGGGVVVIMSMLIDGVGSILASGGNGGSAVGNNGGGGGGGGGGIICLISQNDTTSVGLTVAVAGGIGGNGLGTGLAGSNGSVGRIYRLRT